MTIFLFEVKHVTIAFLYQIIITIMYQKCKCTVYSELNGDDQGRPVASTYGVLYADDTIRPTIIVNIELFTQSYASSTTN